MKKILSFKDFALYEYQKFDNSLYNKINEATFMDEVEKRKYDPVTFKKMRAAVFFLNAQYPFFGGLLSRLIIRENRGIKTIIPRTHFISFFCFLLYLLYLSTSDDLSVKLLSKCR